MVRPTVIDFETHAIGKRPAYPPIPVGVAIDEPGQRPVYLAVGHPTGNNATKGEMIKRLQSIWRSGAQVLGHHMKFDLDVAETHLGSTMLPWHRIEDTLLLAFLHNPHAATLALKPLAEELVGIKPTARNALQTWILENVPEARSAPKTWGAYIALAPGDLVGKYAIADVTMTRRLYAVLRPLVLCDATVRVAYDRERRLIGPLLRMERRGVPLATKRLVKDMAGFKQSLDAASAWLRQRLGKPDVDLDAANDLADALESAGLITEWRMTAPSRTHPGGQRSVSGSALAESLNDAQVLGVLRYRARLTNSVRTFLTPWLAMAADSPGNDRIYTSWNQVRRTSFSGAPIGARTGRLSSTPNLQNVPVMPPLLSFEKKETPGSLVLPGVLMSKVLELPAPRDYLEAPRGYRMNDRDYSQQELRLLGHFEAGSLAQAYMENPRLDVHERIRQQISEYLGTNITRHDAKTITFGIIYGMGVGALAIALGCSVSDSRVLQKAFMSSMPGIAALTQELNRRAAHNEYITTWGGRHYFVEPPKVVGGRLRTFAYKMLNKLIQGSAADVTKEAIIRYHDTCHEDASMIFTVHDESVTLAPTALARQDMNTLREAMESIECSIPMLTTGSTGAKSWARLKAVKY